MFLALQDGTQGTHNQHCPQQVHSKPHESQSCLGCCFHPNTTEQWNREDLKRSAQVNWNVGGRLFRESLCGLHKVEIPAFNERKMISLDASVFEIKPFLVEDQSWVFFFLGCYVIKNAKWNIILNSYSHDDQDSMVIIVLGIKLLEYQLQAVLFVHLFVQPLHC